MSTSLYKITDAMNVPLTILGKEVSGSQQINFNGTQNSLCLPMTVEAKKMFSFEQTGVLFHVQGKLFVLAAHNELHGASSLFFIDARKCAADGVGISPERLMGTKLNLKETVDLFGPAIVRCYARRAGSKWEQFKR